MLKTEEFQAMCSQGPIILDGATGSNLRKAGMPNACCTEEWVLSHPDILQQLQRDYAAAGSQIIYAPTFQAQPIPLKRFGITESAESINEKLVALSKEAAPNCLIAGDLTTLSGFLDSWDPDNFDLLVDNYSKQIRGLISGGADLLVAETLVYEQEAEAILVAAELAGAETVMYSFTMQSGGYLYNGQDAGPILKNLENLGAAAVGFNCVAADMMTPYLVNRLRAFLSGPMICKPNAGNPIIDQNGIAQYDLTVSEYGNVMHDCCQNGASLLGGCCGTTPAHIAQIVKTLK